MPRSSAGRRGSSAEKGSGLSDETIRRADLRVTIPMAPGTESLNVAAAAAICLYQSFSRSAG